MKCSNCGKEFYEGMFCPECGTKYEDEEQKNASIAAIQEYTPNTEMQPYSSAVSNTTDESVDANWPVRSKLAAGLLSIFLGGLGIHKFYLGKIVWGIIYILFCWTGIPSIIGLVEGIIYLCMTDANFQTKYHVRIS